MAKLIWFLLLGTFGATQAQTVQFDYENKPLNEVLIELRDNHQLQFSYNEALVSECLVNNTKSYVNTEAALKDIVSSCGFSLRKQDGVCIITKSQKLYSLVGYVKDATTALPIANVAIKVGDLGTTTGNDGYFFLLTSDSLVKADVSHVGYQNVERQFHSNIDHQLELMPKNIRLNEVIIGSASSADEQEKPNNLNGRREVRARLFLNMDDLLDNRPTEEINTFVSERDQGLNITYYRLDVDKETAKELGKVFSFSDETGFYINPRKPKLRKRANFFESDTIGEFIHFIEIAKMNIGGNLVSYRAEKLLNMRTGKIKGLTRSLLRKLIADDEQLIEMFNREKGKSAKLASYLREYYLRKKM